MTNNQEPFVIKRGPYWACLVVMGCLNLVILDPEFSSGIFVGAVFIGWLVLSYARVKDIGWGGWTAIFCIVPLFNLVIGCLESKPEEPQHD